MTRVFVSLGSNLEAERCVREAVRRLGRVGKVVGISNVWRTEAIGGMGQDDYYNAVALVETELGAREVKGVLRAIEGELGRKRGGDKWAARTIDLDILLYGDRVIEEEGLRVPDPDIGQRGFLAMGIWELEPGLVVPGRGQRIAEIARRLGGSKMVRLEGYTRGLRAEIGQGMEGV